MFSRAARSFHTSLRASHLVGPPHPISNLRPIIYTDTTVATTPSSSFESSNHPYSLSEFEEDINEHDDYKLRWKLERVQLDSFNHAFWADSNSRFNAGLPVAAPTDTPLEKEHALSVYYKTFVEQETERNDAYTREWRRRNLAVIKLGARVALGDLRTRIFGR